MNRNEKQPKLAETDSENLLQILTAVQGGDRKAADQLLPMVYNQLRQLARQKIAREKPGFTLDATALVHEAFLRLVGSGDSPKWDTKGHFFAAASEAMRRILIEIARRKGRLKHGGGKRRVDLDSLAITCETESGEWADDIIELDEALTEFEEKAPDAARLVNLRYFTGLTMGEAAEILGISTRTAQRNWAFAKAWLYARVNGNDQDR